MRKRIVAAMLLPLAACAPEPEPQPIGMPNPASQHCVDSGGRLEIRKDANGAATGYCHLPSGEVVEEWALFRRTGQPESEK